ncbi:MAG: hypothetical protein ACRCZO_07220 [Cetobacterium sp.]
MKALATLKAKVQEDYQSSFEFEKYEIEEDIKKEVIENEAIIFRNFRNMSESLYKVCKALYENSLKLKRSEGSFMAWYENIGLSKDKVSELLKRYDLYMNFPDKAQYITSLSTQAVKLLTGKDLDINIVYDTVELELIKVDDIRCFIEARSTPKEDTIELEDGYKIEPLIQKETKKCVNYKNFEKLRKNISAMDSKQISQVEKEIDLFEKYIKELKKSLADRSLEFDNKNNIKLIK